MCPICSIGVVVSLGLSRWLRVDDSITGVWIGALLLAISIWTFNWLLRKRENKPIIFLVIVIFLYWLLTFIPLYIAGIVSNTDCLTFLGLNRLVFGSLMGLILAGVAVYLDKALRKIKEGKRLFPYQKVIIPIGILFIASLILNFFC